MSNEIKKVIRWYMKMKTWKVIFAILTPLASGEVIAFFTGVTLPSWVHVVVGVSAAFLLYAKLFIKDENNDGIID
jgi:hypothetical protein